MDELYAPPSLSAHDGEVLDEIADLRARLAQQIRPARRWVAGMRRSAAAANIRGSNSIEGYDVSLEDAAAAVNDLPPHDTTDDTWREVTSYRLMMDYVLQMATWPAFSIDSTALSAMHFMLLHHDLSKSPGRWREGDVFVHDSSRGRNVYQGPPAESVPGLVTALADSLSRPTDGDPFVTAAMAHLNLVMIHPFRDGNGRMARALQTLLLGRDDVLEPQFSSIEEWLGSHSTDYYAALAATGGGQWAPSGDATLWVRFCLRAHHLQAQTLEDRSHAFAHLWELIDEQIDRHGLDPRTADILFDAALGTRITRPLYTERTGTEEATASRDLRRMTDLGLLEATGRTRGRSYTASTTLAELRAQTLGAVAAPSDPYPDLMGQIHAQASAT